MKARATRHLVEGTYFRLCHLCNHLNELDSPILACEQCENAFSSPMLEKHYRKQSESDEAVATLPRKEITGLSVMW